MLGKTWKNIDKFVSSLLLKILTINKVCIILNRVEIVYEGKYLKNESLYTKVKSPRRSDPPKAFRK
jgi:hypothetical protein